MKRLTEKMIEAAHEYMQQWVQEENWDDLAVMLMEGDTEMAAHHMCGTGAINSKNIKKYGAESYPEIAYECERTIETLSKRFRKLSRKAQSKRYDEVFKDCLIASCRDCNHVSFVHSGNEKLYPEVKEACWECDSVNILVYRWGEKR